MSLGGSGVFIVSGSGFLGSQKFVSFGCCNIGGNFAMHVGKNHPFPIGK